MRFVVAAVLAATCAADDFPAPQLNLIGGFLYGASGHMPQLVETRECADKWLASETKFLYLNS